MRKPPFTRRQMPCLAMIAGMILLLGAILSVRFLCALLAIALLGWGLWSFWCCK